MPVRRSSRGCDASACSRDEASPSLDLQRRFAEAVPAVLVGKRIDEVHVDRLAGSSGTPVGFNAAIEQIKERTRIGQTTST
jgi:hypothetical protein